MTIRDKFTNSENKKLLNLSHDRVLLRSVKYEGVVLAIHLDICVKVIYARYLHRWSHRNQGSAMPGV